MRDIDNFYINKQEPAKSCLLALREIILNYDTRITEAWYYRTPFFVLKANASATSGCIKRNLANPTCHFCNQIL